jgi:hypothetical protein
VLITHLLFLPDLPLHLSPFFYLFTFPRTIIMERQPTDLEPGYGPVAMKSNAQTNEIPKSSNEPIKRESTQSPPPFQHYTSLAFARDQILEVSDAQDHANRFLEELEEQQRKRSAQILDQQTEEEQWTTPNRPQVRLSTPRLGLSNEELRDQLMRREVLERQLNNQKLSKKQRQLVRQDPELAEEVENLKRKLAQDQAQIQSQGQTTAQTKQYFPERQQTRKRKWTQEHDIQELMLDQTVKDLAQMRRELQDLRRQLHQHLHSQPACPPMVPVYCYPPAYNPFGGFPPGSQPPLWNYPVQQRSVPPATDPVDPDQTCDPQEQGCQDHFSRHFDKHPENR